MAINRVYFTESPIVRKRIRYDYLEVRLQPRGANNVGKYFQIYSLVVSSKTIFCAR